MVTTPSGGQVLLDRGFYNVSGLAWSGAARSRGSTCRSTAGATGARPRRAGDGKCLTRFNIDWAWDGKPAIVQSRATDETGHVQPTYRQNRARAARARSITTTPSSRGWCRRAGGEECPALVRLGAAVACPVRWQRLRAGERFPASAANPRRAKWRPGTSTCPLTSRGLPKGQGSVSQGQDVWEAKCASCHGIFGESNSTFSRWWAAPRPRRRPDRPRGAPERPAFPGRTTLMKVSTVSTLWDYINRAMPWTAPKSLSVDEVYAVTAYLLNLGGIVPDDFVLRQGPSRRRRRAAQPQRHDHRPRDVAGRQGAQSPTCRARPCMTNCEVEAQLASFLPDFARNAHGNLAEQNRMVGARMVPTPPPAGSAPEGRTGGPPARQPRAPAAGACWPNARRCTACHAGRREAGRSGPARGREEVRRRRRCRGLPGQDPRRRQRRLGRDTHAAAEPRRGRRINPSPNGWPTERGSESSNGAVLPALRSIEFHGEHMQTRRDMLARPRPAAALAVSACCRKPRRRARPAGAAFEAKNMGDLMKAWAPAPGREQGRQHHRPGHRRERRRGAGGRGHHAAGASACCCWWKEPQHAGRGVRRHRRRRAQHLHAREDGPVVQRLRGGDHGDNKVLYAPRKSRWVVRRLRRPERRRARPGEHPLHESPKTGD